MTLGPELLKNCFWPRPLPLNKTSLAIYLAFFESN